MKTFTTFKIFETFETKFWNVVQLDGFIPGPSTGHKYIHVRSKLLCKVTNAP